MWPFSSYPVRALDDVASKEYDYIVIGGEPTFSLQVVVGHVTNALGGLRAAWSLHVLAKTRVQEYCSLNVVLS